MCVQGCASVVQRVGNTQAAVNKLRAAAQKQTSGASKKPAAVGLW